jgi:hypothetical protein
MAFIVNAPVFSGAVTLSNGPLIMPASQGIQIPSGAPGVTTNTLYSIGGSLYFNGMQLAAGSGIQLSSTLVGFTLGTDGTPLAATDTVLQGFQKLQVQVNAVGGTIVNHGTAVVDFGAAPGHMDAKVTITGLTGITANSIPIAAILVKDSADHTADEHWLEDFGVSCGNIVPGTGFDIILVPGFGRAYGRYNVVYSWI